MSGYGILHNRMRRALPTYVEGKVVLDLGAGDLTRAEEILEAGAKRVIAVEKEDFTRLERSRWRRHITVVRQYFLQFNRDHSSEEWDVALVSWPANTVLPGLIDILSRCTTVVYIGSNLYPTSCGFPELYTYFMSREVLCDVFHYRNSFTVYGETISGIRDPTMEERAALLQCEDPFIRGPTATVLK